MIRRLLVWALTGSSSLGSVPVTESRMAPADAYTRRQCLSECGRPHVETAADRVRRRIAQEQQVRAHLVALQFGVSASCVHKIRTQRRGHRCFRHANNHSC